MNYSKTIFASMVIAVAMLVSVDVVAGNPAKKLGRGISNVALGALEIPIKMYDINHEEGGIASVTYGVFLGIGYFVAREVVGITEIVTFFMPLAGCKDDPREEGWGYGPIMYPEWVVDNDHDIWNIVYQDLSVD